MLTKNLAQSARLITQSKQWVVPTIATRCYAAPANAAASRPPVALFGIDGTYASALYTAAAKTDALEPVSRFLQTAGSLLKKDTKLQQILSAPSLTPTDKSQIVQELLKSTNTSGSDKAAQTVKSFLTTLSENNRLGSLEGVCEKFDTLMSAHRGEVELVITSAAPLEQKMLKQLETSVSKSAFVGQGKKLKVVPKVNPEIKGGLIVEVGDRTIDLSVASKMSKMNKLLQDSL